MHSVKLNFSSNFCMHFWYLQHLAMPGPFYLLHLTFLIMFSDRRKTWFSPVSKSLHSYLVYQHYCSLHNTRNKWQCTHSHEADQVKCDTSVGKSERIGHLRGEDVTSLLNNCFAKRKARTKNTPGNLFYIFRQYIHCIFKTCCLTL